MPRQKTEPRQGVRCDRAAYGARNRIERTINRLTQYRVMVTRDEPLGAAFDALVTIAAILLWR